VKVPSFQKRTCSGPLSIKKRATMKAVRAVKRGCIRREFRRGSPARNTRRCTSRKSAKATAPPSTGEMTQLATVLAMAGPPREPHPWAKAPTPMSPPTIPCVAEMGSLK